MDNIFREAVEKSSRERKDDTTKRLSFYHDEQVSYIQQALTVHYVDVSQFTPTFFNVVKKITNQLSIGFIWLMPKETLTALDVIKQAFSEIVESSSLNMKMKVASRYSRLLKTVILRPVWRKGKMDLDILTGDILDVLFGDTPRTA